MAKKIPKRGKYPTTITIDMEQDSWLRKHPEFNLSQFVREKLDEEMKN